MEGDSLKPYSSGENWCRSQFEISRADLEWNVQVPCLETTTQWMEPLDSTLFSSKSTPDRLWKMQLIDMATDLRIQIFLTTPGVAYYESAKLIDPVRVKMAILNRKRQKVLEQVQALPRDSGGSFHMLYPKAKIIENQCQQSDGSLTFYSEIESYVKKEPVSGKANDDQDQPMRNSDELIDQLEKLYENKKYADVIIRIGSQAIQAHKAILASRSEVFDATLRKLQDQMVITHKTILASRSEVFAAALPRKLQDQMVITDIHPDVFDQLLRFIYTGRLSLTTMEARAAELYFAADKYFLHQLKDECKDHLIRRMSPENCIQLLLNADRQHSLIDSAIEYFRLNESQVKATDSWKTNKEKNAVKLLNIQEMLDNPPITTGTSSSNDSSIPQTQNPVIR